MAQPTKSVQQDQQPAPAPPPRYCINEEWIEQSGRSLQHMIETRLPQGQGDEKGSKRKKAKAVSMSDLGKVEGFVSPDLPMLEAVFRLLLVHENKPMDVEQISQELAENGIGIRDARSVRPDVLVRLLDSDRYYGLGRV
jgi:hypothetical protein